MNDADDRNHRVTTLSMGRNVSNEQDAIGEWLRFTNVSGCMRCLDSCGTNSISDSLPGDFADGERGPAWRVVLATEASWSGSATSRFRQVWPSVFLCCAEFHFVPSPADRCMTEQFRVDGNLPADVHGCQPNGSWGERFRESAELKCHLHPFRNVAHTRALSPTVDCKFRIGPDARANAFKSP